MKIQSPLHVSFFLKEYDSSSQTLDTPVLFLTRTLLTWDQRPSVLNVLHVDPSYQHCDSPAVTMATAHLLPVKWPPPTFAQRKHDARIVNLIWDLTQSHVAVHCVIIIHKRGAQKLNAGTLTYGWPNLRAVTCLIILLCFWGGFFQANIYAWASPPLNGWNKVHNIRPLSVHVVTSK